MIAQEAINYSLIQIIGLRDETETEKIIKTRKRSIGYIAKRDEGYLKNLFETVNKGLQNVATNRHAKDNRIVDKLKVQVSVKICEKRVVD